MAGENRYSEGLNSDLHERSGIVPEPGAVCLTSKRIA